MLKNKDERKKLIKSIWESEFLKKYLGTRRMKKVFEILLEKCDLSYEPTKGIELKYQETYKKFRYSEWFKTSGYALYKLPEGFFRLTVYTYDEFDDRKENLFCFDTNLNLRYSSEDSDIYIIYRKKYLPLFEESYRHYESLYKEPSHKEKEETNFKE